MNAFEIRTRMLEMAAEQLNIQYENNLKFANLTFDHLIKTNKLVKDSYEAYMPKAPTFEEIVEKAKELYKFVE
jgi:hypothetical protein